MYLLFLFFFKESYIKPLFSLKPPSLPSVCWSQFMTKHFVNILSGDDQQSKCLINLLFYKSLFKTEDFPISKTGVKVRP